MLPDIVNLRQFYTSPLGRLAKRRLRRLVQQRWPHIAGSAGIGLGYTTDLLPLPQQAQSAGQTIVALMPATQGAIYWPVHANNHSALCDEMRPPIAPSSLQRVLMAHVLEHADAPDELLRIWWQALAPGGRLIVLLPNRYGSWAYCGDTPFRKGTPYAVSRIRTLLNTTGFTLREVHSACFLPPSTHPLMHAFFSFGEFLGALLAPRLGGVLVIEAEKHIYAGIPESSRALVRATAAAAQPALAAAALPVSSQGISAMVSE